MQREDGGEGREERGEMDGWWEDKLEMVEDEKSRG